MDGGRPGQAAAEAYDALLKTATARTGDAPLRALSHRRGRWPRATAKRARKQFLAIARDFPAHPLADEALRRSAPAAPDRRRRPPPPPTPAAPPPATPRPPMLAPADRLRRAESLTKDRHWDEALAELAKLPATLPPELAAERDYQIGMTKFHMRRDYPTAGELLLGAVPQLPGDKAASAAFHGARALSRVDRDDEAIAGYRKVVAQFPRSRWAAEAQYLSGWLEYNRGRFRESLPALQATLDALRQQRVRRRRRLVPGLRALPARRCRRRRPPAWNATARLPGRPASRPTRSRARVDLLARAPEREGRRRSTTPRRGYRELAQRAPLSFYGLLARARLKQAGPPRARASCRSRRSRSQTPSKPTRDPSVARADELIEAGMGVEAGDELERNEKDDPASTWAATKALPWLLDLYKRAGNFHRATGSANHAARPRWRADPQRRRRRARHLGGGVPARLRSRWSRSTAPPAGNPDLFLYAIMRKESGFDPHDVSYADARGLLQMIPPTSTKVAAATGEPFFADQLYDPEINIRLGAHVHRLAVQQVRARDASWPPARTTPGRARWRAGASSTASTPPTNSSS